MDGDNETIGAGTSSLKVGGITKGKGCITYAESSTPNGLIKPAMYKVEVAWQGVNKSIDGGDTDRCRAGQYGADNGNHRLVSYDVYVSA